MRRFPGVLTFLLIGSLLLTACAQSAATPTSTTKPTSPAATTTSPKPTTYVATPTPTTLTPKYGGTLTILASASVKNFGWPPELSGTVFTADPALEMLVNRNAQGGVYPALATSWQIAADAKSITFNLRKGVKFTDGTDFNSAAVKYTFLARQADKRGDLDRMTSVDIIDGYTLRVNLSSWDSALLENLGTYSGYQGSPTAIEKMGHDAALVNPVGTGPFKFASFKPDYSLNYVKNDSYWDTGKPYLDGINFLFFSDLTTQRLAFLNGEGDIMTPVQPIDVASLKAAGLDVAVLPNASIIGTHLMPDSKNADSPFAKLEVREAVDYAINKQQIVDKIFYGLYTPLSEPVSPTNAGYVPGLARNFDPAKAKQLLAAAGYPNGFQTTLTAQTTVPTELVQAVQSFLKDVGINTTIEMVDSVAFYNYQYNGWKNKLIFNSGYPGGNPITGWNIISTTAKFGSSMLRVPGYQDLLDKGMAEPDYNKEITIAKQMTQLVFDQEMLIPLYQSPSITAFAKGNHDSKFGAQGGGLYWTPAMAWKDK